ncbi:hypothetical protein P171DRAFT_132047 [Karstenula rhodostoma CBS 690.94]|uniref:Uncharacterized protein n=1 Tax=Karstenula rhodostoma CBS 690.94 TaxID=1392251 RepID=A0A9P4U7L1_9PLEO|nr:hypothetical protein P171DRAFT_132047 [Karstenula rhodostoma CBS 690.94]
MSTPKGFEFPDVPPQALEEALNRLEQEQREPETPKLNYFTHLETDHKYICEQAHRSLTLVQVDRVRSKIKDNKYHQIELDFYRSEYAETIHNKLLQRHRIQGELTLEDLQGMKQSYRRMLVANGVDSDTLRRKRLAIKSQQYWKSEAGVLKQHSRLREEKMLNALRRQHTSRARSRNTQRHPVRRSSRVAARTSSTG